MTISKAELRQICTSENCEFGIMELSSNNSRINDSDLQGENISSFTNNIKVLYLGNYLYIKDDFSKDATLGCTKDFTIIQWSNAAEELLGYTKEEIIGSKMDRIVPEEYMHEVLTVFSKLEQGVPISIYETVRKHKDGRYIPVSISVTPLYYEQGDLFGVYVLYRDISDKKRLMEQLSYTEELWRSAIQGGKFGVWEWFIDTDQFGFHNDWPKEYGLNKEKVGYTFEEWFRLVHKEDIGILRDAMKNALQGKEFLCEYRFMDKNGQYIWTRAKGNVIKWNEDGSPLKMIGTNEDITERKRLEEQLEHYCQQLEEAYKAKTNFMSYISHEIRVPMNGIFGLLRLLNKTKLDTKQVKWLNMLKESLNSLMEVINNILDQSKIEAGKLEPENSLCNIKMITREIYNQLSVLAKPKRLQTKFYYDSEIQSMVYSDKLRLRQILLNLVDNAVKFTKHGSISLEVHLLESDEHMEVLEFRVIDTGIGISEKEKKRIFEGFTQGNLISWKKSTGAGLGLTIAKQIANLLNGDITVDSVQGEGSIFKFYCTFEKYKKSTDVFDVNDEVMAESVDLVSNDHSEACFENQIILVVEDNEINLEIISDMIRECGCHLLNAYNADDALSLINKYKVDVILLDIQMSGLDGFELIQQIRRNDAHRNVPIIAMASHETKDARQLCIEAGMNDIINKPIDTKQCIHKIKNAFATRYQM